jgi:hypothetical protein
VSTTTWQARTARALVIGAVGEGVFGLLAVTVANGFAVATIVVAIAVGWYLGPVYGGLGAGFPPVGIAFVPSDDGHAGQSISVAIFVLLLLGGSAWLTGRVRERYGKPPWAQSRGPAR